MRIRVEVCVTSVAEAEVAARCGADTVELCVWLASGGVTPSAGLIMAVKKAVSIPVRVLVRPTPNGFVHSTAEHEVLLADAQWIARSAPVPGIVTGALLPDGSPDLRMVTAIKAWNGGAEVTFHKAIDRAVDPWGALERCADSGVDRLLTAGAATTALAGAPMLKALVEASKGRLRVAAAGSISSQDVVAIVGSTGVQEVHFAAQRVVTGAGGPSFVPDEAKIEAVLVALDKAGLR